MMIRPGAEMHFQTLNEAIRSTPDTDIMIENCLGQRYIGAGLSGKTIVINGTPGVHVPAGTMYGAETGGARFLYDDEGQLQGIRNLERMTVTRLTSSTAQSSSGASITTSIQMMFWL